MLQGLIITAAFAASIVTPRFSDVRAAIHRAHEVYGETLVVFDLDNTILATNTAFGSEHWFLWQADLIAAGRPDVASNISALLRVQGWILAAAPMHATDPEIAADLQAFGTEGIKTMALTSRSLDVRDATLRELARNSLNLADSAPGPKGGYADRYMPADTEGARPVIYEHGVLLVDGQDKGVMLRAFLAKTGYAPKAIVFVDDRAHHLQAVQDAFANLDELVTTIQMTHEVPVVEAFKASDKAAEKARWCLFAKGLTTLFPKDPPFIPCLAP